MILELFNDIFSLIENVPTENYYWIALFSALLETTIGAGLLFPGSTVILVLGALCARGHLDINILLGFSIIGALLGDNLNYYLGRKYGNEWLKTGFFLLKSGHIEKAKYFMDSHGAKSIFLGRFIPSVKEIIPFIAGSVQMNRTTFMFWNILGAIGWGFEWVFAGYIFAQSLNLAELWLSRAGLFFAFLLIVSSAIYLVKWVVIRKGKQFLIITGSLGQSIKQALLSNEYVYLWIKKNPRIVVFLKARIDATVFSGLTLTLLALAFLYVLALFAGIVEDLITADIIVALDIHIANLFFALRTDTLTHIFTWITLLGKSQIILVFTALSVVMLYLWQKSHYILPLVVAISGSALFAYLGKLTFHRSRPELAVYTEHSFSFPSRHAAIAVVFYGFISYLLIRISPTWNRKVNIFFVTLLIIIAIGFSRVYLGVHYISDVWSGYLMGTMWLIIAISLSEWLKSRSKLYTPLPFTPWKFEFLQAVPFTRKTRPLSFILISIATLFYIRFAINYHPSLALAQSKNTIIVSKSTDIFFNNQMKYTETLFGEKQQPINFIFLVKSDNQLVSALRQAGWILTDKADISSLFKITKALVTQIPQPSSPIAPSFWNNKIQDISFTKLSEDTGFGNAQHLKIWRTNFLLKNGNKIYAGLVNANDGFKWGIIPKNSADLNTQRERLYQDLIHSEKTKSHSKKNLVMPQIGKTLIGEPFFTDGKMYIISM